MTFGSVEAFRTMPCSSGTRCHVLVLVNSLSQAVPVQHAVTFEGKDEAHDGAMICLKFN